MEKGKIQQCINKGTVSSLPSVFKQDIKCFIFVTEKTLTRLKTTTNRMGIVMIN